jgi:hypothetical protein
VYLVFFFTRRGFPKITGNIFCPFSEYKTVFIDLNTSPNFKTVRLISCFDENIRQVLGDLLYLVRFPIMERKYFTENVSKKGLLSHEEIINVYQSLDDEEIAMFPTKWRNIKHPF